MLENAIGSFEAWLATQNLARIAVAFGIVASSMIFKRPIAQATIYVVSVFASLFAISLNDEFQTAIRPPIELFVFGLAVLLGLGVVEIQEPFAAITGKLAASLLVIAFFYGAFVSGGLFVEIVQSRSQTRVRGHTHWIVTVLKVTIVIVGLGAILNVWGIDIGPVLTGMGIAGAAIALAAQDLVKNLIAGASNIGENRFEIGDWIHARGVVEGTVEAISLRSTKVRQFDLALVNVPNADLADAPLMNFSRVPHRRIYWTIHLAYSTTRDQLTAVTDAIRTYIEESDNFVQPPQVSLYVCVDSFNDSSIDVLIYCFTKSAGYADYLTAKEQLALEIKQIVEETGAAFAFPSRTIYIERGDAIPPAHSDSLTRGEPDYGQGSNEATS